MATVSPTAFAIAMAPFVMAARVAAVFGVSGPFVRAFARATYPSRVPELERYEPTEHDVFVATFVKSGTNWALQIAQQLSYLGKAEFDHIHEVVPWPEAKMPGLVALDDMRARDASPTGLRVIKTHASLALVPYRPQAACTAHRDHPYRSS
jgi:hypothetical protein